MQNPYRNASCQLSHPPDSTGNAHSHPIAQLEPEPLIMIDCLLRQKFERLLISPGQAHDLLVAVARLDSLRKETPALLDEPKEAGEEALGPGGCRLRTGCQVLHDGMCGVYNSPLLQWYSWLPWGVVYSGMRMMEVPYADTQSVLD